MNYHTHGVNALARMVPDIKSTNGPLTDTTGSTVLFHRDVERYDVELRIAIVTNGTASGTLLVRLPSPAPTDRYQWFQGISSTGASLLVKVIGFYAEITLAADGSYPGANGVALTTSFTYYAANNAQGAGFSYAPANFNNDHWYTRGGLITGLADGKQGTIITTLHTTGFGGDGTSMRLVHTNTAKMTLFRDPSNFLHLQLRNAAGTLICEVVSLLPTSTSSPEHTIFVSWDLNTPEAWLFIKGVNETGTPLTLVNDTVDYTDSNFAVGGTVGGLDLVRGTMDFFWFNDTFHHPGNYINNGCFFDEFDAPIDVGKYGDALTGGLPRIFLRNLDVGSTFATNRGTGGNFTLN
jgi:hypothetical protein